MKNEESEVRVEGDFSMRDMLVILFKFKYRILWAFVLITLVLTVLPLLKRPVYEAKSSLLIKIGRELRTDVNGSRQLTINQDAINNSEIQILTSHDSVMRAIEAIKLENLYPDILHAPPEVNRLQVAAARFTSALTVQEVKNSNVIEISFRHDNPRIAALAVNKLVDIFKEKHLEVLGDTDAAFLESQLARYESKLHESENKLQEFKQRNGVVSQEEQVKLLLQRSSDIEQDKIKVQNRINELATQAPVLRARAKRVLSAAETKVDPKQQKAREEAEVKLMNMQLEEQQLLKKYTESSTMVQSFRKQIDLLKSYLEQLDAKQDRKSYEADPAYQAAELAAMTAETELKSERAKLAALQKEGLTVAAQIRQLEQTDKAMQNLTREQAINEKNYQAFVGKAEEARISKDMNSLKLANVSVIQTASVPIEPVEPNVVKVLLRGLLVAISAGIGVAIVSEFLSDRLSTPHAVERRLGLRVLLSINKQ